MNDIFIKLNTAVETFDNKSVNVVPSISDDQGKRYLQAQDNGYQFSQRKMLSDIDLAINSIFKKGRYDKEGQRKLYLNIVRFYLNVAIKNTDIDTKNFVLSPADYSDGNIWSVWFLNRQFKNWVKDGGYAKTINELVTDYNKYGTCLSKRVGDDILRVPLRAIRNDQSAKTLLDSVEGGVPVIEEHEYSYVQMLKFKDVWTLPDKFEGKRIVYEMYSYLSKAELKTCQGTDVKANDKSNDEMVLTMAILMPTGKEEVDKRKKYNNKILFIEQVDELPYNEAHSEKQDGRWLGTGEVEKQLENQIARNLSANLRRRSMLWASKQIFQTQGDVVAKNLVKDVQDGEVFQVGLNGLVSKVDTSTRSLADYQQDEQVWEENSQRQSFAFESATGESFSSGTPFRLGALLSNTVMSYFDMKKEILGIFFQETFYEKLIPIFQKRAKDDVAIISQTENGYKMIVEMFKEMYVNNYYADLALSPDFFNYHSIPDKNNVEAEIEKKLIKSPYLFVDVEKTFYKNAKYNVDLNITDESRDGADAETLTTLYTSMVQAGDPRATKVLDTILASKGKNIAAIAGMPQAKTPQPADPSQAGTAGNPNLQGLVPQTN